MEELSLNILDIAKNSVKAGATLIKIILDENKNNLSLSIIDNGCGMNSDMIKNVENPFFTTRTTRKVGLGIPFLKQSALQTGGNLTIKSSVSAENHGTEICATFKTDNIDFIPLGDVISTLCTLIQGSPNIDFYYKHKKENGCVILKTSELKEILGDDISLSNPEIIIWIRNYLKDLYKSLG